MSGHDSKACRPATAHSSPTLAEKAEVFEGNLKERHWLDGLYVSLVRIDGGGPPDHSPQGFSEVRHAGCWTGRYLAAQAFRYALTKDPEVRREGDEIIAALRRLHAITGKRGLLARGYLKGSGLTHEERTTECREWRQGTGDLAGWRWRGDVSKDNYHAVFWGYGLWYDLAADEDQKALIREEVGALADHTIDHGYQIVDVDGQVTSWGDLSPEYYGAMRWEERSVAWVLLLLGLLKTASHITGEPRHEQAYEAIRSLFWNEGHVPEYASQLKIEDAGLDLSNHSDELMAFEALDSLVRYETDEPVRAVYREMLERLWEANRDEGTPVLNYLYQAATGKDGRLEEAARTLQDYPLDRMVRPVMNSLRPDVKLSRLTGRLTEPQAVRPLPLGQRPLDNEFEWKANPYRVDDWHQYRIVSVAGSPDGSTVFAVDSEGLIYRSLDGARTWNDVSASLGRPKVRQVVVAGGSPPVILVLADKGVFRSADAGETWERTWWPRGNAELGQLLQCPGARGAIYLLTLERLMLTLDSGASWTPLDPPWELRLPASCAAAGPQNCLWILDLHDVSWRREGEQWTHALNPIKALALAPDPLNAQVCYLASAEGGIQKTLDGGTTWHLLETGPKCKLPHLTHHPGTAGTLWAAAEDGEVFHSTDGGDTWRNSRPSLDVPLATCLQLTADGGRLYLGTAGALHASEDGGKGWSETGLRLVVRGAPGRFETGSADYLLAYWMGRHFGYLGPEE